MKRRYGPSGVLSFSTARHRHMPAESHFLLFVCKMNLRSHEPRRVFIGDLRMFFLSEY
jgi:hypothetical protein